MCAYNRVNGEPAGSPWRINMMPTGTGAFYLYLHGDVRRASKTAVGDMVTVDVEFDSEYRGGPMELPDWLRTPLAKSKLATSAFEPLTPSRQKEIVRYMANLKSAEARERNLARVMKMLTESHATVRRPHPKLRARVLASSEHPARRDRTP